MPVDVFNDYWLGITVIEAQEMLNSIIPSSWAYLKPSDQKKQDKELRRLAYNLIEKTGGKVATLGDLAAQIAGKL